jgi:DNA transformation protein
LAITAEYRAWLEEIFSSLGRVSVRRFFDLDGLYCDDAMFGLVADDRIYFKTDEESRRTFELEGAKPLIYRTGSGEIITTSYFALPEQLYDDRETLSNWAQVALGVALRSPTAARKRNKERPGPSKGRRRA